MDSRPKRGVLYIVWGDKVETPLQRSMASLRKHHPDLPIHVERLPTPHHDRGLSLKSGMGKMTPFESTLYLDADTLVMGKLDAGFERAEQFGLACCICECPWLRRYDPALADRVEYNTGVLFFSPLAKPVFDRWPDFAGNTPSSSRWTKQDSLPRGLNYDDQASFARAVESANLNPFVLPLNYNIRPEFQLAAFAPIKIWHAYGDPPANVLALNRACEEGRRSVTWLSWVGR